MSRRTKHENVHITLSGANDCGPCSEHSGQLRKSIVTTPYYQVQLLLPFVHYQRWPSTTQPRRNSDVPDTRGNTGKCSPVTDVIDPGNHIFESTCKTDTGYRFEPTEYVQTHGLYTMIGSFLFQKVVMIDISVRDEMQ